MRGLVRAAVAVIAGKIGRRRPQRDPDVGVAITADVAGEPPRISASTRASAPDGSRAVISIAGVQKPHWVHGADETPPARPP
jgi:hypothetical protein